MKLTCLALASAVLLAGCGSQKDTSKAELAAVAKTRAAIQSAFNARDGQTACNLMTPRLQHQVAAIVLREAPLISGTGCVALVDAYGKELMDGPNAGHTDESAHGGCVDWRSRDTQAYNRAIKQSDVWKFDGSGKCAA